MIKQLLLFIFVFLVTITIAIVSLVIFLEPSGFKAIISDRVKQKTGYNLIINSDLRWHIWPQVSLLTDSITLSADGATKPLITASNMRLDVEILPLFSKKLAIKNVFIKSPVINLTDESKGIALNQTNKKIATVNQTQLSVSKPNNMNQKPYSNQFFELNKFMIADGTLVLQKKEDMITVRNINLAFEKTQHDFITMLANGDINRDQQNLNYELNANLNLNDFPQQIGLDIRELDYSYEGVDVPTHFLKGKIKGQFDYQFSPATLSSDNIYFSFNNNEFTGKFIAVLDQKNTISLSLASNYVDLTPFLMVKSAENKTMRIAQTTPVIVKDTKSKNEFHFLNKFNAKFLLDIKKMEIGSTQFNNVNADIENNNGIAAIHQFSFDVNQGKVIARGSASGAAKTTQLNIDTTITDLDIESFLNNFDTVSVLKGKVDATGNLTFGSISPQYLLSELKGQLKLSVNQARLDGINILGMLDLALSQYSKTLWNREEQDRGDYSALNRLEINAEIDKGMMDMPSIIATSNLVDLKGKGALDLVKRYLELTLSLKVNENDDIKNQTIGRLANRVVPLRIYGDVSKLNYQIDVSQLVKDLFDKNIKQKIDTLRERIKH